MAGKTSCTCTVRTKITNTPFADHLGENDIHFREV